MKKLYVLALGTLLSLTACGSVDFAGGNPNNPGGNNPYPSIDPTNPGDYIPSIDPALFSIDPAIYSIDPALYSIDPAIYSYNPYNPSYNGGQETDQSEDKGNSRVDPTPTQSVVPGEAKEAETILEALTKVRSSAQKSIGELNAFTLGMHLEGLVNTGVYRKTTVEYNDGNVETSRKQWDLETVDIDNLDMSIYLDNAYDANFLGDLKAAISLDTHDTECAASFVSYYYYGSEQGIRVQGEPAFEGVVNSYLDNGNIYASVDGDAIFSIGSIVDNFIPNFSQRYSLEGAIPVNGKTYMPLRTLGSFFGLTDLGGMTIGNYTDLAKNFEVPHFDEEEDLIEGITLIENMLSAMNYHLSDFIDYRISSNLYSSLDFSMTFGPEQYNRLMSSPLSSVLSMYLPSEVLEILSSADLTIKLNIDRNDLISNLEVDIRSLTINGLDYRYKNTYQGYDQQGQLTTIVTEEDLMDIDIHNLVFKVDLSYGRRGDVFPSSYQDYGMFDLDQFMPKK